MCVYKCAYIYTCVERERERNEEINLHCITKLNRTAV